MKRPLKILLWILATPVLVIGWLWTLGAGYYMAGGGGGSALGTVVIWSYILLTVLVLVRFRRYTLPWLVGTFIIGLVWLVSVQSSNERNWRVEVAREPSITREGDLVTIRNIRNFKYRAKDDFDAQYYEKTFDLSKLETGDLVMCYWDGNTDIAHTMLTFGFDGGKDHVCLSVEVRREEGEDWGGIPGIYRQFEVIYILADERDLINLRTSYRGEEIYLYRLQVPTSEIRQYFEVVLRHVDRLSREPEFYDTLRYNCSSSLTHMAEELWPDRPRPKGLRALFNGHTDEHAYANGRIFTGLPFDEVRKQSYITEIGYEHRDSPDFSQKIREGRPGMD